MTRFLAIALRVAAVPIGVGAGFWTASQVVPPVCPPYARFPNPAFFVAEPRFALWVCALFGAAAATVVLIISVALTRLRPVG